MPLVCCFVLFRSCLFCVLQGCLSGSVADDYAVVETQCETVSGSAACDYALSRFESSVELCAHSLQNVSSLILSAMNISGRAGITCYCGMSMQRLYLVCH